MLTTSRAASYFLLLFFLTFTTQAQTVTVPSASKTVFAAVTAKGLRFTAVGGVKQMRLEIFAPDGVAVADSGFRAGNVYDWSLEDGETKNLSDGTYQFVITLRDLSGHLSVKECTVVLQGGETAVLLGAAELGGGIETNKTEVVAPDVADTAVTLVTNTGTEGQISRTRGAFSFRVGDFFSGQDREQMRLTEAGDLGLGTGKPQARLDVRGDIHASGFLLATKGIVFADGSIQTSGLGRYVDAHGNVAPTAAGSGTQNQIAKWAESGGAGTLGNSAVTEVSGNVGIGTTSPVSQLHLAGPSGVSAITFNTPGSHRFRFQTVPGIPNWGALTLNANYNAGWLLDDVTSNGYFFKLDSRSSTSGTFNGLWLFRVPPGSNPHTDETPIFGVSSGQAYFASNVGVGTFNPQSQLEVAGNIRLSGAGNSLIFPDGTSQSTASIGGMLGSGTVGTVPVWTGSNALGNSLITQSGNTLNLGSSVATVQVPGSLVISGTGTANVLNATTQINLGGNRILSTNGLNNFFGGLDAGASNTSGNDNTFLGAQAGRTNGSGNNNSFVGAFAGYKNTTGVLNSFFGDSSGHENTTSSGNSFFGAFAGERNLTGDSNSFFGNVAGQNNSTGDQNSFVGWQAGRNNTSGGNNTFLGTGTGASNTTGGNNTLIGASANVGSGTLIFATAIGAGTVVDSENTIVLGRKQGQDSTVIWGRLQLVKLGSGGTLSLCRNSSSEISTCSSSLRYKTKVAAFSTGLSLVQRLHPIRFEWKGDGMKDIGFGAEDVAAVEPLLVTHNAKGEVEGVKYDRISAVLVNAVKEQQAQLEAQQIQLKQQQSQLATQQGQIKQQQEIINSLRELLCKTSSDAKVCQ